MLVYIDIEASVKAMPDQGCMLFGVPAMKGLEDLHRYERVIRETKPEVIVQTGTAVGGSAKWLANRWFDYDGPLVITIDVDSESVHPMVHSDDRIVVLHGSSIDGDLFELVRSYSVDRRTMVILDSDHSSSHVGREIEMYSPLVSSGCYLVVEDGIYDLAGTGEFNPGPLDAILSHLVDDGSFERDIEIEKMETISMYPAGWWKKK